MNCCVLGIDPGLDGGWAVYQEKRLIVHSMPTRSGPKSGREIDVTELHYRLHSLGIELAAVELVHSMPAQGVRSVFTFGRNYGATLAVLELLGIPIQHVTPQRWKKDILAGLGTDKSAAIRWCQARFPKVRFTKSDKATKPHDGMCDATCLAEFARRIVAGGK